MAQGRKLDAPDDAAVWIANGADHGKPVRYRIRPIPYDVDRRLHRQAYREKKLRQLGRENATASLERAREYTLLRACYALVDTENFSLEMADAGAAAQYARLLGLDVAVGAEVYLDGRWSDAVKTDALTLLRNHAAWISNRADKLVEADIQDEEEETADF